MRFGAWLHLLQIPISLCKHSTEPHKVTRDSLCECVMFGAWLHLPQIPISLCKHTAEPHKVARDSLCVCVMFGALYDSEFF